MNTFIYQGSFKLIKIDSKDILLYFDQINTALVHTKTFWTVVYMFSFGITLPKLHLLLIYFCTMVSPQCFFVYGGVWRSEAQLLSAFFCQFSVLLFSWGCLCRFLLVSGSVMPQVKMKHPSSFSFFILPPTPKTQDLCTPLNHSSAPQINLIPSVH